MLNSYVLTKVILGIELIEGVLRYRRQIMKRKVVVLGGGTGSSTLLRGLKEFPLDITAIVSVCDDGSSTGVLREEFSIPAVGDIRRVLVALSETEPLVMELFNIFTPRIPVQKFKNSSFVSKLICSYKSCNASFSCISESISSLSRIIGKKFFSLSAKSY